MAEINATFGDRERMEDILSSQKQLTAVYNTSAGEASSAGLQSELLTLLGESHKLQLDVFLEMNKRGWYNTQPAPQQKLDQAREQFQRTNS